MLFYTGRGDKGNSFVGKKKFPKDNPILVALGDLDELNSLLGIVRAMQKQEQLKKKIEAVQQNLFIVQARIAWFLYPKFKAPELAEQKVRLIEQEIHTMEKTIHPKRGFVIAGSSLLSSWLDYARAVARRAERSIVIVSKKHKVPQEILAYLNRLSSYLYALARLETYQKKLKESRPTYR